MKFPHQPFRFLATLAFCAAILAVTLLATPPAVGAQENPNDWVNGGYAEEMEQATTQGSVSQSPYTARSFDTPMYRTIEHILGPVPGITVTADVWQRNPQYAQRMLQKSAVAGIGNYIAMIYANPPADLALWIQDTGQTLGFLPKRAYAQGVGFSGLAPLLPIWKAFRNIAYLLLAIVMIVIGFMVMLRKKIDPKTVVTVQNALPRIVITLLLITFSYAIVGVLVDMMYVIMLFGLNVLDLAPLARFRGFDPLAFLYGGIPGGIATIINGIRNFFNSSTPQQIFSQGGLIDVFYAIFPYGISSLTDLSVDLLIPFMPSWIAWPVSPFVAFLLALLLLFLFIRLLFLFLRAYIQIIISLVFSPIMLLGEALPGGNSLSSWFNTLIGNLIVFPAASFMFALAYMLSYMADTSLAGGGVLWSPPFLQHTASGVEGKSIASLLTIGLLMVFPTFISSIQEKLKSQQAGAGVFGPAGGLIGTGMSLGSMAIGLRTSKQQQQSFAQLGQAIQSGQQDLGRSIQQAIQQVAQRSGGGGGGGGH